MTGLSALRVTWGVGAAEAVLVFARSGGAALFVAPVVATGSASCERLGSATGSGCGSSTTGAGAVTSGSGTSGAGDESGSGDGTIIGVDAAGSDGNGPASCAMTAGAWSAAIAAIAMGALAIE
ncbi:MAG: hypothetical protein AB3N06_01415 [Erythrobacter sp.]